MPEAELSQKRIDGASLNTLSATTVSNLGCLDMVQSIGDYERQRSKSFYLSHRIN
jgi:hypothetical protein